MIAQAEKLIANANEEYNILMGNGRYIPANLLKFEISQLKSRVEALRMATMGVVIRGLELDIKLLSVKLNTDIHVLGFMPTASTTEATPSPKPSTAAQTVSSTNRPSPTSAPTKATSTSHS